MTESSMLRTRDESLLKARSGEHCIPVHLANLNGLGSPCISAGHTQNDDTRTFLSSEDLYQN